MVSIKFFDPQVLFLESRFKIRAHPRYFSEMAPICLNVFKFHLFSDGKFLEMDIRIWFWTEWIAHSQDKWLAWWISDLGLMPYTWTKRNISEIILSLFNWRNFPIRLAVFSDRRSWESKRPLFQMWQEFGSISQTKSCSIHSIYIHGSTVWIWPCKCGTISILNLKCRCILVGPWRYNSHFIIRVIDSSHFLSLKIRVLSTNWKVCSVNQSLNFAYEFLFSFCFSNQCLFLFSGKMQFFLLTLDFGISACTYFRLYSHYLLTHVYLLGVEISLDSRTLLYSFLKAVTEICRFHSLHSGLLGS